MENNRTRYLSPKQIFEIYGIETNKTYYWIREGRICYIKAGEKTVLIPEKEFVNFLENRIVDKTRME